VQASAAPQQFEEFNYLAVLISIVLGLGITQLLSGFGRWLEHRASVRVYAPSIVWAGLLLIIHVQTWWSMFGLRENETWTFVEFSIVLLQPILLFLLATLVLPGNASPEQNLRANYFAQRTWFFGLLAALLVTSVIKDLVLNGALPDTANLVFHAILFTSSSVAALTSREFYHRQFAYSSIVFVVAYIALLFAQLS
jgi:hypothetical protein